MTKVLVVEDDHLVRKGFIALMPWQQYGFEISGEASNGNQALEFLQANEVDLLITDLSMPIMSGADLMRKVAQLYPRLQMVVLTFHQEFDYIQEALRLGAIDYITKVELEDEQMMNDVLKRIADRLRNSEQPADNQRINRLKERWHAIDWITDAALFQELMKETHEMDMPPERLLEIFDTAAQNWRRLPGFDLPILANIPRAGGWTHFASWLEKVQSDVIENVQGFQYSEEVQRCIRKAVELIRSELHNELHLTEVAHRVNMSRSYFSRCFKDIVGTTFNDYVRKSRIERAQALLLQTKKPIGWIAAQTGYPNEKYFGKVFREVAGILPSEFRKNARGLQSTNNDARSPSAE